MITLTEAEMRVARLLALEGLPNQQLARRLHVAEDTVKTHLKRIFAKTDSIDRTQFVVRVWSNQIVIGDKNGHLEL